MSKKKANTNLKKKKNVIAIAVIVAILIAAAISTVLIISRDDTPDDSKTEFTMQNIGEHIKTLKLDGKISFNASLNESEMLEREQHFKREGIDVNILSGYCVKRGTDELFVFEFADAAQANAVFTYNEENSVYPSRIKGSIVVFGKDDLLSEILAPFS